MSAYKTDEEQLEALKSWWKDNGRSVVIGAVLGLGIIFGWQGWQVWQTSQGEAASSQFGGLQQALQGAQQEQIENAANQLIEQHGDTAYAALTRLHQARLAYQQGDKNRAQEHLEQAMQNLDDEALKALVGLRLIDLLIDMQAWQAAQQQLDALAGDAYAAELAIRRGDLARQAGDQAAARRAYQDALKQGPGDPELVQMKLAELAKT